MMRPILSRQEYMALRDSETNRRADKMHMVQMNYSCLPGPSPDPSLKGGEYIPVVGPLKGATRASNTVGMDIDYEAPIDTPKEEVQALYDAWMKQVLDLILAKKEEVGLLMLERSATKGYHIVFKRRAGMSQEENLRWASELLGVSFDKGAKDITRVFFTPADKLLYLDDTLFVCQPAETSGTKPATLKEEEATLSEITSSQTNRNEEEATKASTSPFGLRAFDLCVKAAGLNASAMDIWGQHNWHANLMAVLSVGLPKLMSKQQLLAVVRSKLPNYAQTEDCAKLIEYFYEKYSADKGFMSVTLRQINALAQSGESDQAAPNSAMRAAQTQDDKDITELTQGWEPPQLPKKIPRVLELLAGNYDPKFREMLLLAALPVLSAHASHFRAVYLNGKTIGPQQYVAVIGSSGKGKGYCTSLYDEMTKYTLQEHDDQEWAKVDENTVLREKMANAKEKPAKYHPKLRLFETTSKSSILDLQKALGKNGMLLGQFSEVDGLSSATKSPFSDISVLLRKAWDGDIHRQYYMSDSTCNAQATMSISLLMAGTVRAMLERMFSDSNCEGGLMQRCIPVIVPKTQRTFRPPMQNFLSEDEKQERDSLILSLYHKDLALGDDTLTLETPMTNRTIGQWFDELEMRYSLGLLTEAEADLSSRCGQFMLRAAIPLIALYGKETKEIVDFCRWVGEMAHYAMSRLFGYRVQKDIAASEELMDHHLDSRKTAEPLLDSLPSVFTIQEFKDARVKAGQSPEATMLLTRYVKCGKLERVGKGIYKKKNEALNQKNNI